jgi:dTDP-4-dehydrorhamnose 3,5-epimerase-like enzyme
MTDGFIGGAGKAFMVDLPVVPDARGKLTFIESFRHVPFDIKRVYYLYDVPTAATRAGHAHKELEQVLIAVSGSFTVLIDDSIDKASFTLNRPNIGLYVGPSVWREIDNFSSNAVCLVLASRHYDEADYYRSYETFKQAMGRS